MQHIIVSSLESKVQSNVGKEEGNFLSYLRSQRKLILVAASVAVVVFILLKIIFPYPDLFVDSINYIFWAVNDFKTAFRPMGYSHFLQVAHSITSSSAFLVFLQYAAFFSSSLFLFLTVDYLFGLPGKFRLILLYAVLLNPLLVFQSNLISSDSLFSSLTVTWFALILWILKQPKWQTLVLQMLFLYLSFQVRYTAMFFPAVAIIAFLLCPAKWVYKIGGIGLTAIVILFSVQRQKDINEEQVGARIFSGFSGWQIANNAIYCYKKIDVDNSDLPGTKLQDLDRLVRFCIDSVHAAPDEIGVAYLWNNGSPLKKFCMGEARAKNIGYFDEWHIVSTLYNEYGWYIVTKFPGAYCRYYLYPNTIKYFYPDIEAVSGYDPENMVLPAETKEWFNLDIDHLECRVPKLQETIIVVFPVLSLLLNVFIIVVLIFSAFKLIPRRKSAAPESKRLLYTWGFFYFSFMAFSIFATPVNLRFMDTIFVIGLILPFVFLRQMKQVEADS